MMVNRRLYRYLFDGLGYGDLLGFFHQRANTGSLGKTRPGFLKIKSSFPSSTPNKNH
jgi:hypothetical protein